VRPPHPLAPSRTAVSCASCPLDKTTQRLSSETLWLGPFIVYSRVMLHVAPLTYVFLLIPFFHPNEPELCPMLGPSITTPALPLLLSPLFGPTGVRMCSFWSCLDLLVLSRLFGGVVLLWRWDDSQPCSVHFLRWWGGVLCLWCGGSACCRALRPLILRGRDASVFNLQPQPKVRTEISPKVPWNHSRSLGFPPDPFSEG
jgi:hypothetical protein